MFCPKCRYTSFDHLPACPKCAYEWSEQKKTFNMEWMVPTATEGMNIFTPASPEGQAQPEEAVPSTGTSSQSETVAEEEIDLEEADLESVGDEASLSGTGSGAGQEKSAGQEASHEVDEEISFEGLQDFFTDLTEEGGEELTKDSEAASGPEGGDTDAPIQEPDLEIELEDQSAEEEQAPEEPTTVEQDDLDLDISSILEDIDNESEDGEGKR